MITLKRRLARHGLPGTTTVDLAVDLAVDLGDQP